MGQMPQWFAKTRDMVRSDQYFSLKGAGSEDELVRRYADALKLLKREPEGYYDQSKVLPGGRSHHFDTDWINRDYPDVMDSGGRYWPTIPSWKVVSYVRDGTFVAICKALGHVLEPTLGDLSITQVGLFSVSDFLDQLFVTELEDGVEIESVLPLATSWNCVAPAGSDFFEVDALRGPSVVELAIATPRPLGMGLMMPLIEEIGEATGRHTREHE